MRLQTTSTSTIIFGVILQKCGHICRHHNASESAISVVDNATIIIITTPYHYVHNFLYTAGIDTLSDYKTQKLMILSKSPIELKRDYTFDFERP